MRRVPGCCSAIDRCGASCVAVSTTAPTSASSRRTSFALGYAPEGMVVDEEFDADTTTAVRAWQEAQGVDETGSVWPADVVFAPGERRVSAHLGSVGGPADGEVLGLTGVNQIVTLDVAADDVDRFAVGDEVVDRAARRHARRRRRVVDRPGRHRRRRRRRHDGRGRHRPDRTDRATRCRSGRRDRHARRSPVGC